MSKQLIQASLNLDLAKSYNPAQDAVEQIGKAVDSYVKYEEQQSEKAYKIAEGLQEGMVGFDLMNDQAQTYYEDQLQVVATELASARAKKDSKEVRRLLAKGKSLVEDQNKIGQIIYAHSQDKLSDTYVAGANTHVLDLLVNKKYEIIEKDEERFIKFETTETGDFKDGVSINDLDKYAIIKDPNIANNYLNNLNTIAKQAGAGKSYLNSPGQNSVNVTINDMLKDVDGLQNALFTRGFQLKDGNRIADLYYIKSGSKLPMNEFVNKFMTPGRDDYDSKKLTEFVKQKLQDGALNHNNYYFEEKENKSTKKSLIIEQLEKGDKYIQYDQYNTLVRRNDGTYTLIENKNKNRDLTDISSSPASDWIKFFGGTVKENENENKNKKENENEDDNVNNDFNNSNNDNFTLPLNLVTDEVNDDLFAKFEEIAPGFTFEKNPYNDNGSKRTSDKHDHYIVTAPNGGTLKIELDRSVSKESTRKRLEKFINNNRTK